VWLKYAPNRLSTGASPQTPLGSLQHSPRLPNWFSGWGRPRQKGRREGRGKGGGEGGEVVPECPNSELASLGVYKAGTPKIGALWNPMGSSNLSAHGLPCRICSLSVKPYTSVRVEMSRRLSSSRPAFQGRSKSSELTRIS